MRIILRLTAALSVTGVVAITIYAILAIGSEGRQLRATAEREIRLLSRSLEVAVENALRDNQTSDIHETLLRLELIEPAIDIGVYDSDGSVLAMSTGSRITTELEGRLVRTALLQGETVVEFSPEGGLDRLALGVGLFNDEGGLIGALALGKPLTTLERDLEATRAAIVTMAILFALATSIVGLVLGRWFVGKPIQLLLGAIRRAGAGEPLPSLPVARRDEIGEVAREFAELLVALDAARAEREQEEARRRTIERAFAQADKLITVGRLSARFAHEIGSPLQVLVGRAEAITGTPDVPAKIARHAGIIAEQGHRIVEIVRSLLVWSRPAGEPVPTSPRREIQAIFELLSLDADRQRVVFKELYAENVPDRALIVCRPGQLQQVTFNLVKNAMAALPHGGDITLGLAIEGEALLFTVTDTGPGIPEDQVQQLFEPFFSGRLDEGGIGLGLTIVRGIVDDHGGSVTIEQVAPHGTRVLVRWPLVSLEA